MSEKELLDKLTEVFREVFDDESLIISKDTSASDIPAWDSLGQVTLLGVIEDTFDIKFSMKDMLGIRSVSQIMDAIYKY